MSSVCANIHQDPPRNKAECAINTIYLKPKPLSAAHSNTRDDSCINITVENATLSNKPVHLKLYHSSGNTELKFKFLMEVLGSN